ncbi:beta-1,4 N-acetylgalactosaminyltransferase 2-like [Bombina bombina]|uniref:beta-1,4 N-acetylgalactosaminyltransferase 2-like n=1 Tax=Bombina bombina TaxID=8345 RepID=UPI00235B1BB8|nr:beta-1,4 N-acetylgalactosaminyltransferase 2-like [Bombina bombina]XP_053575967.1 beta-1,4 N-acetylgalactosaminyltransferase 2-like [Bombina bombina]XP_053575968.1 beta-1,4 N-acetylgalactosaminyltransferase 2-like [Bombina bombina]
MKTQLRGNMRNKSLLLIALIGVLVIFYVKMNLLSMVKPQNEFDAIQDAKLKLLPRDKILSKYSYSGIKYFSDESACSCDKQGGSVYQLKDYYKEDELASVRERRKKELQHFKKRYWSAQRQLIIAPPNSPLSYPIDGVQVLPFHTIIIEGLSVHEEGRQNYEVSLSASLGVFDTLLDCPEEQVKGRGDKTLRILTPHLQVLNHILKHITYTSTSFHTKTMDTVKFQMANYVAAFPVEIKQLPIPILYDSGPDTNLRSLVTITTKTFFRYDKLRYLIKSIRQFYPDIQIIIADDNDKTEKIDDPYVEQYFMPYAKGWFAGRNLAVSQVTTKYFLWVDDDVIFTEQTDIKRMVHILEETDLDIIGGALGGNDFKFKILYQMGGEDGDCLHRTNGYYQKVEGFPNCVVAGVVANFFLAHTRQILGVGFDPKLSRVAHSEFFFDGFGSLRVATCSDFGVGHQPKGLLKTDNERNYSRFRYNDQELFNYKMRLMYFKNNLKCYTQ